MSPSDYEMVEQGYDPPRMTHPLEAENRRLLAEIEDERSSHRATMKDFLEMQQVYRAGREQWNPVYKLLLDERDALRACVVKLEKVLKKFKTDMCEGWCDETDHIFSDCQGCEARAALAVEPASGEAK